MGDLQQALKESFNEEVYKCVLSNPVTTDGTYRKMVVTRLPGGYQVAKHTEKQVFHENLLPDQAYGFLLKAMAEMFRQYNAWDADRMHSIRISNKGKVLHSHTASRQAPPEQTRHNRKKNYLIREGTLIQPLVDMGIFTQEGRVVRSMYDKYRQINRFVEMVDDEVKNLPITDTLTVIDFGCGKSYLTFVLYHYFTEIRKLPVRIIGLDLNADVVDKCQQASIKYGYTGLRFEQGDIDGYRHDGPVDMVITLHACDTATDFALYNAIRWNARLIFSVPCCQHELNAQIRNEHLAALTRYGLVKERVAALMTDAIRGNLLDVCGYKTQLMEFIEMEHTPKNILIRAVRRSRTQPKAATMAALAEVETLIGQFHLDPTLYRLLKGSGEI